MKTTLGSFLNQFVALVQGDDVEAQAEKTWRQAKTSVETQLAALKGETFDREQQVEEAEEKLRLATLNNGKSIEGKSGRTDYINQMIDAQNKLTSAKEALEEHNKTVSFLKTRLEFLKEETK
jgi:hypothetical protein